ncbi:peptide chain release factor 2 [Desulfoferula mesophila]|uniref:Peptide chain release factor 2 n=2 Tax=Desulfoferula mesophila TaxID=3058419 RepID=A0AAU9F213_9BACT|nr:peptide chain release factor 2 [Desulfoferula mesophilus]
MAKDGFWDDQEAAKEVMQERSGLTESLESLEALTGQAEDAEVMLELSQEEQDKEAAKETAAGLEALERGVARLEAKRLLGEPDDHRSAILAINAGAGGTDAQDWADMLLRLYSRFAERQGFEVKMLDLQEGDEAGIKSVTLEVNGHQAYGLMKGEAGIHRLVRISPFDASHRRHTAFASVSVSPQVDDDIEIEINENDLRIDTYRASGAGGQHVNKTSSAVRITHLPTGTVVQCQNEKSQHRNRDMAMKVLRARLYELELAKRQAEKQEAYDSQQEIAWGSQIRSYVLAPYRLVKDHRTGVEVGNVDAVLDGDLEEFVQGYLLWRSS